MAQHKEDLKKKEMQWQAERESKKLEKQERALAERRAVTVDLLDGEKVLWKHERRKGFFNVKMVEFWAITNYRVIKNRDAVDLAMIQDAVLTNVRTEQSGGEVYTDHYDGFSISSQKPIETWTVADIAFAHENTALVVFPDISRPEEVVTVFRIAKREAIERLTPEDEDKSKPIYVKCPHCSTMNLPAAMCNVCGKPLNPVICQSCKAENPPGSYSCAACGAKLTVL
jgi:hypothetical protein